MVWSNWFAQGVFAVVRTLFRWEASHERPGWVRVIAIGLIILFALSLVSMLFSLFVMAFYVLLAIAAVGAVLAFLGMN